MSFNTYDGGVVVDAASNRPVASKIATVFDDETGARVKVYMEGQERTLVSGAHGLIPQFQTEDSTRRVRIEVGPVRLRQWSQEMVESAADASGSISSALEQVEVVRDEAAAIVPRMEQIETMAGLAPGEVTDAQTANLVSREGTATRDALNAATEQTVGMVDFARYNPDPANAAPALQAALDDLPDGGVLNLGTGGSYRLGSRVATSGKSVGLHGRYVQMIQAYDGELFNFTGGFGPDFTVSALDYAIKAIGDSSAVWMTRLTVTGHDFTVGDTIKIVSDDLLVGRREQTARSGESKVVLAVEGDTVWCGGLMRPEDTYTTNVRAARWLDHTFTGTGEIYWTMSPEGFDAGWKFGMVTIAAAKRPRIKDWTVQQGVGPWITFDGCLAYEADQTTALNLRNQPALGRYGYGINDKSSELGNVKGMYAQNVRHAWTTSGSATSAGGAMHRYGRSAYATVNGHALGTTNSSWDTHEEAYAVSFVDCVAKGTASGNSASGAGYTSRGMHNRFVNCGAIDTARGFTVHNSFAGSTVDPEFVDCWSVGTTMAVFNTDGTAERSATVRVRGGSFDATGHFIRATRTDLDVRDVDVKARFDSAGYDGPIRLDSSTLTGGEIRIDMTGSPSSSNVALIRVDDTAEPGTWGIDLGRVDVKLSAGLNHLVRGGTSGMDATKVKISDLRLSRTIPLTVNLTGEHGMAWAIPGDSRSDAYQRTVDITAFTTPSRSSGADNGADQTTDRTGYRRTITGQGSFLEYDIPLKAGTYQVVMRGASGPTSMYVSGQVNGSHQGSADFYETTSGRTTKFLTFTVPFDGVHRLRFKEYGRNTNSTGWVWGMNHISIKRND